MPGTVHSAASSNPPKIPTHKGFLPEVNLSTMEAGDSGLRTLAATAGPEY